MGEERPRVDVGDKLVALAVVTGAHGLRGELKVKLYNPSSELLSGRPQLVLRRPGEGAGASPARVRAARPHGRGQWLIAIEGCRDRDAAAALRGVELCVARASLPPLPSGEHYLVDLIGLRAERAGGQEVGTVEEAIAYPASQVLRVRVEGGALEIPLCEPYLVEVRLDEGRVIVDHLEDLELLPASRASR